MEDREQEGIGIYELESGVEDREELWSSLYEENYDIEVFIRSLTYRESVALLMLQFGPEQKHITDLFGLNDSQNQMARRVIQEVRRKFLQFKQR
jgi:hypothetical protein